MQVAILAAMLLELAVFEPQLTDTHELHIDGMRVLYKQGMCLLRQR